VETMTRMREFELIRHVRERSADLRSAAGTHIEIAPGDDMAMLRVDASPGDGGVSLLASTDQVVDGRHVDLRTTSLELVGRKTLTRCLSDVAAMAVRPIASLVSVVLPASMTGDEARVLFDAMQRTAGDFAAPLIGGDVASHARSDHPLTCSTTVLAVPGAAGAIERRGGRVGDRGDVTGRGGGSLASGRHPGRCGSQDARVHAYLRGGRLRCPAHRNCRCRPVRNDGGPHDRLLPRVGVDRCR